MSVPAKVMRRRGARSAGSAGVGFSPLILAVFVLSGCATALSSFQPGHVPEPGHWHAEAGVDISYPTASIEKTVNAADALEEAAKERQLTQAEVLVILEGGANLAANPPTVIPHLGVAYAPWQHWEVGLRFAATGWRLSGRRQLLTQSESGVDFSLGLGLGRSAFAPPVDSFLETVSVDDFARWTIDVPMTLGRRSSWYRWWAGPRLLYSHLSSRLVVTIPAQDVKVAGTVTGDALYVGGFAGAAFGYESVFVGPELTVVQLFGSGRVEALSTTADTDIDSLILYPAFAVMGEF